MNNLKSIIDKERCAHPRFITDNDLLELLNYFLYPTENEKPETYVDKGK